MNDYTPARQGVANENQNSDSPPECVEGSEGVDPDGGGEGMREDVEDGGEGGRISDGQDDIDGEVEVEVCSRRQCCPTPWNFTPREYWSEIKVLLKLAWPNVVYMLLEAMMTIMAVLFSGHLGKNELAAASLANSITTVFTRSVGLGFASSCDTLFSQFYGSPNKRYIGIVLQRGFLIMSLLCFVCWGILVNAETILLLAQQNVEVARLAGVYCLIYIPAVPADYYSMLLIKYLQSQSRLIPVVITAAITNILSIGMYYTLIYALDMGLVGTVIAQVTSHYVLSILITIYIFWKKLHEETWTGWSRECLNEWSPIVRLGVAGCLMVCLEWWSFDVGFYLAGLLGEEQIGAHAIIMYTATTGYMLPYGIGIAAAIRIGNSLGGKQPRTAHIASMASLSLAIICAAILAILYAGLKDVIPYLFTSDSKTVELASAILPICAMFAVLDATATVCGGVIRGTGRQAVGAGVNLLGYYLIGLPLGISLMFAWGKGVYGFWSGMTLGLFTHALIFVIFILRLDWRRETKKAQERVTIPGAGCGPALAEGVELRHSDNPADDHDGSDCEEALALNESTNNVASDPPATIEDDNANTTATTEVDGVETMNGILKIMARRHSSRHGCLLASPEELSRLQQTSRRSPASGGVSKGAEAPRKGPPPSLWRQLHRRLLFFYLGLLYLTLTIICRMLTLPLLRRMAEDRHMLLSNLTTNLTSQPTPQSTIH